MQPHSTQPTTRHSAPFTLPPTSIQEVETQFLRIDRPFSLVEGQKLEELDIAYETYGTLNAAKDNAVLLFHAFSGSQHACGVNRSVPDLYVSWTEQVQIGWWNDFIGPGKALDTDHLFVICANMLGGCYGTTGPSSIIPGTEGKRYGKDFPWITARDVAHSQALLLDHLGIDKLHSVVGPSLGGIMAISFALEYPDRVSSVIPIGTSHAISPDQISINFHQVQAIDLDPNFNGGDYYNGEPPHKGLVLARQLAQMTFVDKSSLIRRAGNQVSNPSRFPAYRMTHPVESYLRGNAARFVDRFDANSYLVMLDLWQRSDLLGMFDSPNFETLFGRLRDSKFLIFGIDSDNCFPVSQQEELHNDLTRGGVASALRVVSSAKGHDSFLVEPALYTEELRRFLEL